MARLFVYSNCNSHISRAHIVCVNARRAPKIYRVFNMTSYSHRHSCSHMAKMKTQNTNAAFAFTFRFSHCLHSIQFLGVKCLFPKEMPIVAKQTLREREKRERECRKNETIRQAVARGLFIKKKMSFRIRMNYEFLFQFSKYSLKRIRWTALMERKVLFKHFKWISFTFHIVFITS